MRVGPRTERWVDAQWGPLYAVVLGAVLIAMSVAVERSYRRASADYQRWSYARSLRAVHRYLLLPVGVLTLLTGVAIAAWRLST